MSVIWHLSPPRISRLHIRFIRLFSTVQRHRLVCVCGCVCLQWRSLRRDTQYINQSNVGETTPQICIWSQRAVIPFENGRPFPRTPRRCHLPSFHLISLILSISLNIGPCDEYAGRQYNCVADSTRNKLCRRTRTQQSTPKTFHWIKLRARKLKKRRKKVCRSRSFRPFNVHRCICAHARRQHCFAFKMSL